MGFPCGSVVKNPGLIPALGRFPGGGHGNPLQYSCLGNPMDRGVWPLTVHGVTKSRLQLNNWTCSWVNLTVYVTCPKSHKSNNFFFFLATLDQLVREGNGTPLQYFAWKIPWMEEPGRLQSMGSLEVGHNWVTSLSLFTFLHWRRKWQPTPVFLPGES